MSTGVQEVQPCSVEVAEYKAEASDTEEELEVLQIMEVPPASKSKPPENWFSDDAVPIVPPPPALPDVVQQQDPSGGLPLIPSARGKPSEREAWHTETALATLDSQNLALPSVTVGPTSTFQDAAQSPPADHEVAIALPFEASPVDVGSAPPDSSRTEPLSLLTPRTDEVIAEAPLALTPSPAPVSRVRQLAVADESREQLVPVSEEPQRSSCTTLRELHRTEMHPTSLPQALQPAKPQSGFAQHRLSQICLRDSQDPPHSSAADSGSTIHDDFRQLPRKIQAEVVNLYQELEDAKNSKQRAEQENTEIMNYLSAILSDDRPEQFALMDGPLETPPPELQEEAEKQHQQLPQDAAEAPKETTASPQQLEPPPPLPFPSEHLEASAQAPPAPTPDFLTKPLVSINFGGGPPEGWGDRRSDHVLQDSFASVLPMAFRQLLERPQSEQRDLQDRQQLQEGLHLMQQQLQLLQQQLQGKSESQPSQRSLLEQLRAELAAERRQMHEQQRQQFQQDQKLQEFQQQQIQQQLEQQIHELQNQVKQQAQQPAQVDQSAPSEMQKMMAELRKSGEATLGELRAALEELRQSKEHRGNDGSGERERV
eukprot:Skav202116  [mRNA]  locus=scaffold1980:130436:132229:+ [translate_table: standard]